jgi:hypothetical protein
MNPILKMKQSTNRESIKNVPDELAAEAPAGVDGVTDLGNLCHVSVRALQEKERERLERKHRRGLRRLRAPRHHKRVLQDPAALVLTPP